MLTTEEVAGQLAVSVKTIRRLVRRNELPVLKITRRLWRFRPADVEHFVSRRAVGATTPGPRQ